MLAILLLAAVATPVVRSEDSPGDTSITTPKTVVARTSDCVDVFAECQSLGTFICKGAYRSWSMKNCRKFCNLCGPQTTAVPTPVPTRPTPSSQNNCDVSCLYKGQHYRQGETWLDGCEYNCTCRDASLGYYRCIDLCPDYTNLPPGCHLIQMPGECCGTPDCDYILSTVAPNNFMSMSSSPCYYQGTYYGQDQTWNDGCRQTCTCTEASTGAYTCRTKCLNWNRLPSDCRLDDPPQGMCCKQPSCPPGAIINIPNAYKDDYPSTECHPYNYV